MEPFFTTKPTGKGTGLGLAMARGFAGQSGGALALDSQPGRGTTVTLWLPQAQAAAPPQPPPAAAGRPADRQRRLLLAEDTDLVRETLAAALEAHGYEVVRAADGAAAAAALEQESAARDRPFDLLITDLTMPGLSGLEVIRAAHRHWPGLPAILLTGYAGEAIDLAIYDALDGNNVTLLRKPISEARLADRVAALLDGAEALPAQ
jgi:CheY-like chemotaxis protein